MNQPQLTIRDETIVVRTPRGSVTITAQTLRRIEDSMLTALVRIESVFHKSPPIPKMVFKVIGRSLGRASWSIIYDPSTIRLPARQRRAKWDGKDFTMILNPLYLIDNLEFMLRDTIPHEIAHIASVFFYGNDEGKYHGYRWRQIMNLLGLPGERVADSCQLNKTNLITRTRKVDYYAYKCSCQGKVFRISSTKHNRLLRGYYKRLWCPTCKADIVYQGKFVK